MPAANRLRSRILIGSLLLGGLGVALTAPAQALQSVKSVTTSNMTASGTNTITFPLFNPFDPALGKSLVLTGVQISLTGSVSGNMRVNRAAGTPGTTSGTLTSLHLNTTLANWFGAGDIPDQTGPDRTFNATVTGNTSSGAFSTTMTAGTLNTPYTTTRNFASPNSGNAIVTVASPTPQTLAADVFDLTPYLSYFIGSGNGTTDLTMNFDASVSAAPNGWANSLFGNLANFNYNAPSGGNNFVVTYDYYIYEAPGPLPVAGGVAAFGWSRRMRRRLRDGRQPAA